MWSPGGAGPGGTERALHNPLAGRARVPFRRVGVCVFEPCGVWRVFGVSPRFPAVKVNGDRCDL